MRAAYSRHDGRLAEQARGVLAPDAEVVATDSEVDALRAVESGEVDVAVVRFDDSVDGSNAEVVDHIVFDSTSLLVRAEVDLPTTTNGWEATARYVAVATSLLDDVAAPETLIFLVPGFNRPGTLSESLASLSSRGINLSKFDSRPLAGNLGMYGFLVEFEGSPTDPLVQDALSDILQVASTVKYLGTFSASSRVWGQVVGREIAGNLLTSLADLDRLAGGRP